MKAGLVFKGEQLCCAPDLLFFDPFNRVLIGLAVCVSSV